MLYNYNVIPLSQAEVDYVNQNDVEFIPMFGGAYAQIEQVVSPMGWPLASGSNRRCYLWTSQIPTSESSEYYNSDLCTVEQLVELINATATVLNTPIRRVAMFNEPWPQVIYPENSTEGALFYKNMLEPIAQTLGLEITSATTQANARALVWDVDFFKACSDLGCDLNLITQWSIHEYQAKYDTMEAKYGAYSGNFYTDREAAFASGYGAWNAGEWSDFFQRPGLLFTEHSASEESQTSFGAPDNVGTCHRFSGQFGDSGLCNSFGNSGAACNWGMGSLAWLLEPSRQNIVGVFVWPAYYSLTGSNQEMGRASRMVYEDGTLTPTGRAFLAMPNGGMAVDCVTQHAPTPPPPPASPPFPRPPIAPVECAATQGRLDTQTAFANPRWCWQVKTTQSCDAYYTLSNDKIRLCYNPIAPEVNKDVMCLATDEYEDCYSPFPPPTPPLPSPPPPPPPSPPPAAPPAAPTPPTPVQPLREGVIECDPHLTELECQTIADNNGRSFIANSFTNMPPGCSFVPADQNQQTYFNANPAAATTCATSNSQMGLVCLCGTHMPPSPSSPPSPPPSPPFVCEAMQGRINTRTLGVNGKWCSDIKTTDDRGGCEGFYSHVNNGNMRLCSNPIAPMTDANTYCAETDTQIVCNFAPPLPPVPPAPPPTTCSSMDGRTNTQTLGGGKFCWELMTDTAAGCEAYFSLNPVNNKMRLCYNSLAPNTDSAIACSQTDPALTCDSLPPSPPPSG